jgi:hypothetical protein
MNTFTISCVPYYDRFNQCYKSILSVNGIPNGPLKKLVRRIEYNKLSPFQQDGPCYKYDKCKYAIIGGNKCCEFMTNDEIYNLTNFLLSNGYQIENQLTNVLNNSEIKLSRNKLLYLVTYYENNPPQIVYMR